MTWEEHWQNADTPWDLGGSPPALTEALQSGLLPAPAATRALRDALADGDDDDDDLSTLPEPFAPKPLEDGRPAPKRLGKPTPMG